MEKISVDQMNVGRSYPIWDSFLNEKLNKLQISTDVKQEVCVRLLDISSFRWLRGAIERTVVSVGVSEENAP